MAHSDGYKMSGVFSGTFDGERVKRNAFHDQRILVINIDDDRIAWPDREIIIAAGEKIYGKLKPTK